MIKLVCIELQFQQDPRVREFLESASELMSADIEKQMQNVVLYGHSHPEIYRETKTEGDSL